MLNDFTSPLDRFGSLGDAFQALRAHDFGAGLNFSNGDPYDQGAQRDVRDRRGFITVNATDMQFAFSTHVEGTERPVKLPAHYSLSWSVEPKDDPTFVDDLAHILATRGLAVTDGEYWGTMPQHEGVFLIEAPSDLYEGRWWWVEDYPEELVEHARETWAPPHA